MLCLGDFVPCDAGLMNSAELDALGFFVCLFGFFFGLGF